MALYRLSIINTIMTDQNFLQIIKDTVPILLIIFVAVLASIIITRIAVKILLIFSIKHYKQIKSKISSKKLIKAEKILPKKPEEKFLKKETSRELVEKMKSQEQDLDEKEIEEVEIVDLVRPVGFWTSMVLGKKLTYLLSSAKIMNKNRKKGFWASMVEAQERAQGREKGRSL